MAIVETETHGAVFVIRMNRPERLNALGNELRAALADAWNEFDERRDIGRVAATRSPPGRSTSP